MKKDRKQRMKETREKIKDGRWFLEFLKKECVKASNNNKINAIRKKFPDLSDDQVALKIIHLYAMKTAGLSMAMGLLAGFAAAAAIIPDILAATRMQIHMLTCLAILYEKMEDIDLDAPESFLRIFAVVVGGWNRKAFNTRITQKNDKTAVPPLRIVSRRLGSKILKKGTFTKGIPLLSSAIGGSLNYVRTQRLGKYALWEFKGQEEAEKLFSIYGFNEIDFRKEIMLSVISVMKSDNELSEEELEIFENILKELDFTRGERSELMDILESDTKICFLDFTQINNDEQKTFLVHTLLRTALSDGVYHKNEKKYIRRVCKTLKMPYPKKMIEDVGLLDEYEEELTAYFKITQALEDSP